MLIVPIEEAEPGMKLASPVTHPEKPRQELLRRGYLLEPTVLLRIRDLGVTHLFVDYPGLEDLDAVLAPQLSSARQMIYQHVKEAIVQAQARTKPAVRFADYYSSTRDLITTLLDSGQHPIFMDLMSGMGHDAVAHATAVAHLAVVLGLRLEDYLITQRARLSTAHAKDVVNLGVASMLHDIGKVKLPESLQTCHEIKQPAAPALDEWRAHVRIGYDMVQGGVEASAAATVLHHHQHFDGTGFPAIQVCQNAPTPQSGHGIHIFARILFAADLFDRLCTVENGAKRSNLQVLHLMRTQFAGALDPAILAMLPSVAPPFLPGTRVQLSDGTSGIVVRLRPETPYRPTVRLVRGPEKLEHRPIDLSTPGAPQIVSGGGVPVAGVLTGAAA